MLARERDASPLAPVMDPRGRWRSSIEARKRPLVVDRGDNVSVRVSLATKDEVRCEVHEGQLNPGASVANLIGAAGATIALENTVVYRVSSAGGAPVLFVRARYVTRQTPPLAGELKIAVSPGTDFSFVCLHDEPGYREAFARSVEGFIAAFETSTPSRAPQYSAIWQHQVGEAKTGYGWQRIFMDPDGSVSSFNFEVVIAELASGEVRVRDFMAVEVHDSSGIRRGNYLSTRGTTKAYELELERSDAGPYTYRGNIDGKPAEGRFTPTAPLASEYEVLVRLRRAREAGVPLAAWYQNEYRPRLDPTRTRGVDYSLDPGTGTLTFASGASSASWSVADGLPNASRAAIGPNTFVGTIVEQHSTLGSEPGVTLGAQPVPETATALPLSERRRQLETHVFAETDHTPAKTPPAGVLSKVTYPAPLGANVAYVTPARPGPKRPAVIWIGGGLDWGIGELSWAKAPRPSDRSARAFRDAGLVTMYPALRGSNENPGKNECFLGEVDDLIAAANFLATRADVDPKRIYLAGHATGGTLALLAAASSDRFAGVFAFGPVSDARQYGTPSGGGCLPADAGEEEIALRAPLNFVGSIRTPTFVFEGGLGGNADVFDGLRERASTRVHFAVVAGLDSTSILAPGTETIARAILAGRVDDAHLVIADSRARAGKAAPR
jgi:acetyl esterase/lipase